MGREGEVCVLPHLAQLGSAAFRRVVPSSLQLALLSLSNTEQLFPELRKAKPTGTLFKIKENYDLG